MSAARLLLGRPGQPGPKTIVITSLRTPDLPTDVLSTLVVEAADAWLVQTPYLDLQPLPNGMGDVFSAVLLGQLLNGQSTPAAASHAVSALYALVARTAPGSRDLPLIAAREQIVRPGELFEARRLP